MYKVTERTFDEFGRWISIFIHRCAMNVRFMCLCMPNKRRGRLVGLTLIRTFFCDVLVLLKNFNEKIKLSAMLLLLVILEQSK